MANNNVLPSDHPNFQELQPRRLISQDQIQQISQNLTEQILKSIKDMKVMSNNERTSSESHHPQLVPLSSISPEETPKKRGKKRTTKVTGEFSLSYEVPPICIDNNIDLDNIMLYDESGSNTNKCLHHQFSFIERLQNWTLQQRERINGTCDVYYNHMRSGSSLRSKKEVVNFLIYEKYPSKPNCNKKDKKPEVVEASDATNNELYGGKEKKRCDEEMERERVVKFLTESYENLMNYDFGDD